MGNLTLHIGLMLQALPIMLTGMAGIFIVTGIIIGCVILINKFL